jgi:hypothetical protein
MGEIINGYLDEFKNKKERLKASPFCKSYTQPKLLAWGLDIKTIIRAFYVSK